MYYDIQQKERIFEPITITVTIETPEELCSLLTRLSVPNHVLRDHEIYKFRSDSIFFENICYVLDDIALDFNLRK